MTCLGYGSPLLAIQQADHQEEGGGAGGLVGLGSGSGGLGLVRGQVSGQERMRGQDGYLLHVEGEGGGGVGQGEAAEEALHARYARHPGV